MKQLYKIITAVICILLFTSCNGKAVDLERSSNYQSSSASQNSSKDSSIQKELSPLALAKQDNPDTVAWLHIPGTDIDNPVMQTTNNEDYLRKNENGKYDIWGSYFADYYSVLIDRNSLKQNTVIYGHSESTENPNGKRFTQLFKYLDLAFVQANPNIYLTVGEEELVFEVVAVFFTDTDFYYIDPNPSDQGFEEFTKKLRRKMSISLRAILSLSKTTCLPSLPVPIGMTQGKQAITGLWSWQNSCPRIQSHPKFL